MVHDNVNLKISEDEATKVEEEAKRRLIASKKLSLVVDLDQTIIHATVDPTVSEWQQDPENPNYEAVKDVKPFQLIDDGPGARGCWYFIKLRPGLQDFLENISKYYELHIYTMGTRAYAQNIASLIDPDRKIFGDRILSRDESGSLVAKNLQRLFPIDTKMVVIIDDRADVWKWNPNLIKVTPYDFFVGIGDLNSSFLPKKNTIKITPKSMTAGASASKPDVAEGAAAAVKRPAPTNGITTLDGPMDNVVSGTTALEQLVSMSGGDDPLLREVQAKSQDEALAAQLLDRPLLQKQKQLDAEDEAASMDTDAKENGEVLDCVVPDKEQPSNKQRHNLLNNDDTELLYLEKALRQVHTEFFETHARQLAAAQGGRIAELRGASPTHRRKVPSKANLDLDMIPDIKDVMPAIKRRVLAGVTIVFSGVVPLGTDIQNSDIALWAKNFGGIVEEEVSRKRTTHLIAANNRTAKVRKAVRIGKGKIKVVSTRWLTDSISQWKRLDEAPYILKTGERDVGRPGPGEENDVLSESEELHSTLATEGESTESEFEYEQIRLDKPKKLTIRTGTDTEDELEELLPDELDEDQVQSPVGGSNDDWKRMHDEMAEFLGSDDEGDSDNDSVASGASGRSKSSVSSKKGLGKRSRAQMEKGDEVENSDLSSRKKLATKRTTNLSQTHLPSDNRPVNGSVPSSQVGYDDNDDEMNGSLTPKDEEDGDGWSEFEGDLEAEMERAAEDDDDESDADNG